MPPQPATSVTSAYGPSRQVTKTRELCTPEANDTRIVRTSKRIVNGMNPGFGFSLSTRASHWSASTVRSPPLRWNVRLKIGPIRPLETSTQPGSTALPAVGSTTDWAEGPEPWAEVPGGFADSVGGVLCRSAADSGMARCGVATSSTERSPSQDAPIVAPVAAIHTRRYATRRCTDVIMPAYRP